MKAARYVGRVGGLAVVFGVGGAVLAGYGVAFAEAGSEGSASPSAASSAAGPEASGLADSSSSADSAGPSGSAETSDDEDSAASGVDDEREAADDAEPSADLSHGLAEDVLDDLAEDLSAGELAGSSDSSGSGSSGSDDNDLADVVIADLGVDVEDAVEDESLAVGESSLSAVVGVASASADPIAGDEPAAPVGAPVDLMLAAAARREAAGEPSAIPSAAAADPGTAQTASAGLFSHPITVAPVIPVLAKGVLQGDIAAESSRGFDLTYSVVGDPSGGGKVDLINSTQCLTITQCASFFPPAPPDSGEFTLLPDVEVVASGGTTQFSVLIAEKTPFDEALEGLPVVGLFAPTILQTLHQMPIVKDLLAPLIGYSVVQQVSVDVGDLAPAGTPVAFTLDVTSFDGTPISTNYFPATGLAEGDPPAPTILNGPGLGAAGNTKPFGPGFIPGGIGASPMPSITETRDEGYNYVSWDPRGEHASGGKMQLDSPFYEGRDVMAIIDYLVAQNLTATEGTTSSGAPDPLIGMFGGSYGGGIQWVVAGIDERVDAIVPAIAWNSLNDALYPEEAFKSGWANLLMLALTETGARLNSQIPEAILTGNLFGVISESAQAMLASSGPTALVENITAPALVIQGTPDGLFVLEQANINAAILEANGVETKMIWFCGGHGICLDPVNPNQDSGTVEATIDWLNRHVKGELLAEEIPDFQWFSQHGTQFASEFLPFQAAFGGLPLGGAFDGGGFLPIFGRYGGSGPSRDPEVEPLLRNATASEASNALNITVELPNDVNLALVVGAPKVEFDYSGFGTAEFVYGQIVDNQTGLVLGNLVQPIPVTLDGQTHHAAVKLENVAYTMVPGASLTLQITSSASAYKSSGWGGINISNVEVALPTVVTGIVTVVSEVP